MPWKKITIPALAFLCIIVLAFTGTIPQNLNYHFFADNRRIFGIPNFWNVITNLPFAVIGISGIWVAISSSEKKLNQICCSLFAGFILLTFGSGYYHWMPNNESLVFDRIPMVVIFMSFFAFIIYDHIDKKSGYKFFFILNVVGVLTVVYWYLSEQTGNGDLRWYGMVQFFPILAIPLILILYKSSFDHSKEIIPIFIFFGLAKLVESYDKEIYHLLNNAISGHAIKHILVAVAEYYIVLLISSRVKSHKESGPQIL